MNWTMPRPVLQVVAALLGACCLAAFLMAAITAPPRGRLPGERLDGVTGQPIAAQDATPLTDERIQGAPEPIVLTEEEKARLEAEKLAREEAAAAARVEADKGAPAGPTPTGAAAPLVPAERAIVPAEKAPTQPKPEEPLF